MKKLLLGALVCVAISGSAWAGGYGHAGHGFRYGHGHAYHGGYDAGWALLGGMLVGGLIGYAINEDRHRASAYPYPPVPTHHPAPTYAPPPATPTALPSEFAGGCVMTREYTTTVDFEGRQHEAYGTRCMQADGSWLLGTPRLPPP